VTPENPSIRSSFALGFLTMDLTDYALRMVDATTANGLTTAYDGRLPKRPLPDGFVILGVNHENTNDFFGTF
jgi:hypothetical protein